VGMGGEGKIKQESVEREVEGKGRGLYRGKNVKGMGRKGTEGPCRSASQDHEHDSRSCPNLGLGFNCL